MDLSIKHEETRQMSLCVLLSLRSDFDRFDLFSQNCIFDFRWFYCEIFDFVGFVVKLESLDSIVGINLIIK